MAAPNPNDALIVKLLTAATQVERVDDFTNDSQFVFNFLNGTKGPGEGGFITLANVESFPALLTGNGAMAVGVLGPCGLNSPHTHPRATEIQILTQGGPVMTAFVMENGARQVKNVIPVGSATLFPKGSIHFQQNMGCEPAVFVASFDYVDPGTQQTAQSFFSLDQGVVNATLGDVGVDFLSHLMLPTNVVLGAQECLDRCHIDRSSFNFTSSFADFAAFSNSSWSMPATLPASVSSSYMSSPTNYGDLAAQVASSSSSSGDIPFSQNPLRGAVIGLSVGSGVLLLACLAMLCMGFTRRRRHTATATAINPAFRVSEGRGYPYATPYDETETWNHRKSTEKE